MKFFLSSAFLLSLSISVKAQWGAQWSLLGNLSENRSQHVLLPLADGKVLAAGGWNGTSNLTTSEINGMAMGGNPDWSVTQGSLSSAHSTGAGVVLANGKALLMGGYNGTENVAICELFDPVSQTWSLAAPFTGGRSYHTATLLSDGKVLITGGYNGTANLASGSVYDPAADTWTNTANSMATGRSYHTATRMKNGKVLIVGGYNPNAGFQLSSVEIYDPATNSFTTGPAMTNARAWHAASLLADGRVLVSGGEHFNGGSPFAYDGMVSCEIYNPATNSWSASADLPTGMCYNQQFTISGNRVLVMAGVSKTNYSPSFTYEAGQTYVYDVDGNTWSSYPMNEDGRVEFAAAQVDSNTILVAGGQGNSSSELFKLINGVKVNHPATGSSVQVFPNPVKNSNQVWISSSEAIERLDVTDFLGRKMDINGSWQNNRYGLNVKGLKPGIYLISLVSGGKHTKEKLVIE